MNNILSNLKRVFSCHPWSSCHARVDGHPINNVRFNNLPFSANWIPPFGGMTLSSLRGYTVAVAIFLFFLLSPTKALAAAVTWDGGASGTLTQNNKVQQTITGTLTINSGGNLTHTSNTIANTYLILFFGPFTKKASAVWYDDNFVVTLSLILNLKSFLMAA